MVIGYHLIWTAYGTWLPNDLRGSGSQVVVSRKLATLGAGHYGRKSMQPRRGEVREFYARAEPLLVHPMIRFDEEQRLAIGAALGDVMVRTPYTCWACAVMADHVHVVLRKHRHRAEEMIERLQEATRDGLNRQALVSSGHPVWTVGGWKVFLDSPAAVRLRVAYVERNPDNERLGWQAWPFVVAYEGWGGAKPQASGDVRRRG
jgi:hypothetical protein